MVVHALECITGNNCAKFEQNQANGSRDIVFQVMKNLTFEEKRLK